MFADAIVFPKKVNEKYNSFVNTEGKTCRFNSIEVYK